MKIPCLYLCVVLMSWATIVPAAPKANSPLAPIQDRPGLPRVLLIGDSISMGYTLPTRKKLEDVANVHRPPVNCGPTSRGMESLESWLGRDRWDLIHFNFGLHDLKYVKTDGSGLVDPSVGKQQIPPDQYEKNLEAIVARLKQTGAILIWRNTTPVPKGSQGRVVGDAAKYNAIAEKVMKRNGIAIQDLFSFSKENMDSLMRPANVHFTQEGYDALADQVAYRIREYLKARSKPTP